MMTAQTALGLGQLLIDLGDESLVGCAKRVQCQRLKQHWQGIGMMAGVGHGGTIFFDKLTIIPVFCLKWVIYPTNGVSAHVHAPVFDGQIIIKTIF